jgi:hypothetical protein
MNPALSGKWFRSEKFVYGLNSQFVVRPDYLAPARQMTAPEVCQLAIVFTGTVGAVTGGALGRDAAKNFSQVLLRDEEEVVNASGAMLRVLEQVERGNKQVDPADISSGATNSSYVYRLNIMFEPLETRAERPRDFRIPLQHFLEGGQMLINTPAAVPSGWAAVQADQRIQVFALVKDGRVPELKTRRRIYEQNLTQQEFDYQVNGSVRCALLGSYLTTTGYTSLAAFSTLFSRTLETPPAFDTHIMVDEYRQFADSLGTNDEFTLATPGAIPLRVPRRNQKIGEMLMTKTLHLDLLAAAPASGKILIDAVIDRTPNLAALVAGYQSPGELAQAIKQHGEVVGYGDSYKAAAFVGDLARKLPIRIRPGH